MDHLTYSNYLKIPELLSLQQPKSNLSGQPAHDELFFIRTHQIFELWFQQILWDLDSIIEIFSGPAVEEKDLGTAVDRLDRITQIQRLLIDQFDILETMTPLDFLEFRQALGTASGMQSLQFRLLEAKMGLFSSFKNDPTGCLHYLDEKESGLVKKAEEGPTLLAQVDKWLTRTPFLQWKDFDFIQNYRDAVESLLKAQEETARKTTNDPLSRKTQADLKSMRNNFSALFEESRYLKLQQDGKRSLSQRSSFAALFIFLYRDEPVVHLPSRFLTKLMDMDELWAAWRWRHAIMVRRMIGTRIGTGETSGFEYLKKTADKHRVFLDLFDLSTYLIPRSELPPLPMNVQKELGFIYHRTQA